MRTYKLSFYSIIIFALSLVIIPLPQAVANPFELFQLDADIIRLKHLRYYGDLIEEYRAKTGSYPFMEQANVPLYVHIASPEQEKYAQMGPPYKHKKKSFKEFVVLLEQGLQRKVLEYYDPQKVPVDKPNFYIYMANQGAYFLAVHLYQPLDFSTNISTNYNKVEISNTPTKMNRAKNPKELFNSESFLAAENKEILKPGFFTEREAETLNATKQ